MRPSSASSSGKKIAFAETAEELQYVSLNHQKYADFDNKMETDDLINFIMGEVDRMESELNKDVSVFFVHQQPAWAEKSIHDLIWATVKSKAMAGTR